MHVIVDVAQAPSIIKGLLIRDAFIEVQWSEGLTVEGKEYGKFVTEEIIGSWEDIIRFDDVSEEYNSKEAAYEWIISSLPEAGDVRIVHV